MACSRVQDIVGSLYLDPGHIPSVRQSLLGADFLSTSSQLACAQTIRSVSWIARTFVSASSKPGAFSGGLVNPLFLGKPQAFKNASRASQIPASAGRQVRASAAALDAVSKAQKDREENTGAKSPADLSGLRVYIILVPLDLPNGLLAAAVDFTRIAFKQRMEHAMTLVEGPDGKCVCFDFRPVDPESPKVCFTLLTGRTSPGILRQSRLSRLPRKNCWLVGESNRSIEEAIDFHNKWDSRLHLVRNNCYTHTDALVEHLTGQPKILETMQLGAQKRLVEVFATDKRKQV